MSPPKKKKGRLETALLTQTPSSQRCQIGRVLFETPLAKWWHRRIELRRCCVKETHTVKAAEQMKTSKRYASRPPPREKKGPAAKQGPKLTNSGDLTSSESASQARPSLIETPLGRWWNRERARWEGGT